MKYLLTYLFFLLSASGFSQIKGIWNQSERKIKNTQVKSDLVGVWRSTNDNPYLNFELKEDKTIIWESDSLNQNYEELLLELKKADVPDSVKKELDSIHWTTYKMMWMTKGEEFFIFHPGPKKNTWIYTKLGAFYNKKDKLYLGNCFDTSSELKDFIKKKEWKQKKDFCAHELIKN